MTAGALAFLIPGDPVGKPRMTRRDVWMKRAPVLAYRAWADQARLSYVAALPKNRPLASPGRVQAVAFFRMPASWSRRQRERLTGAPHQVKPDADNIAKALLDALFDRDQVVHTLVVTKRWDDGQGPRLEVRLEF